MIARRLLIAALLAAAACAGDGSGGATAFEPGVGITLDGAALRLGDPLAAVTAGLGAAAQVRDLGAAGVHHRYPDRGVTVILRDGAVSGFLLDPGFTGRYRGAGLGSDEAAVEAAFGAPAREPFLEARLYNALGLHVEIEAGQVSRIALAAPH